MSTQTTKTTTQKLVQQIIKTIGRPRDRGERKRQMDRIRYHVNVVVAAAGAV